MKNNSSRKLLFTTVAIAFLTILSSIVINFFTGKKDVTDWLENIKLSYLVGGIIFIGLSSILLAYLQVKYAKDSEKEKEILTGNIEPDIKKFFDSLRERYRKRYESKLDGRFEIKLEVSEDWHSDKPKTYKFDAEAKVSDAVGAVRKAFDDTGRLLIVGSPGSGKTVLLLNLARELLGDEYKADQKLPVIFNLASWSEDYENFEDWLINVLNSGNGLSKDFAKTVLREKQIIFLLDGLDELARNEDTKVANEKRAKCLDSLNEYLREGRKAVICCRREEFAEMQKTTNRDAPVSAKVEVLDLTKADILLALQDARKHNESRTSAEHLEEVIKKNEVFLEVLSTPFYFTTALEDFDKHSLKETDFSMDADELKKNLLDKFVESKINHTRNLTEFEQDETKIKKWLKWLAQLMEKKQLITFELLDLQPTDLVYRLHYALTIGLFSGFAISLLLFVVTNFDFLLCLFAFFIFFLFMGFLIGWLEGDFPSEDVIKIDFSKILNLNFLNTVLHYCLLGVFCFVLGLGFIGSIKLGLYKSFHLFSAIGIFGGLFFGAFISTMIAAKRVKKIERIAYLNSPYQRIYGGFLVNFTISLILSLLSFFYILLFIFYKEAFLESIVVNTENSSSGIPQTAWFGLAYFQLLYVILTTLFKHIILRFCLFLESAMPLKYVTFLDYAAEARILEKDGGQWRFRHQNLQEYFASLKD